MARPYIDAISTGMTVCAPQVTPEDYASLRLALRFAYRCSDTQREGGDQRWYQYFHRQLSYFGSDGALTEVDSHLLKGRQGIVECAAQAIRPLAGESLRSVLRDGMLAVKASPGACAVLEQHANQHHMRSLQVLGCQAGTGPAGASLLDVIIYHQVFGVGFSGLGWFAQETALPVARAHVKLVRFNPGVFRTAHQARVKARFEKIQSDYFSVIGSQ